MISVRHDAPFPPHETVHSLRDSDRETLHSLHERRRVLRLNEQMNMVAENRKLHDARAEAVAGRTDRAREHAQRAPAPQVPDVPADPQRHMNRRPPLEPRAPPMLHARARRLRLSPGPLPLPAPPAAELQFELPPHLIGPTLSRQQQRYKNRV